MINIQLTFKDLIYMQPKAGIKVEIKMEIFPRVYVPVPPPPPGVGTHDPIGPQKPPGQLPDAYRISPLKSHVIRRQRTVRTDAQGRININFDFRREFADCRAILGSRRGDVVAVPTVKVMEPYLPKVSRFGLDAAHSGPHLLEENDSFNSIVAVDFIKSIIGEVTDDSARLWFQYHGRLKSGERCVCVLRGEGYSRDFVLDFQRQHGAYNTFDAQIANLFVNELPTDTAFTYTVYFEKPLISQTEAGPVVGSFRGPFSLNRRTEIAAGGFRTEEPGKNKWSFVFGSCHLPDSLDPAESIHRWQELSNRDDYDFMLLIGDQIYGDGIEKYTQSYDWFRRYARRYNELWVEPNMRKVLGNTPSYMIFDDHEVDDDWGSDHTGEGSDGVPITATQEQAGILAYKVFQQAHNPGGEQANNFDYSFRKGPAAFYMMDGRSPGRNNKRRYPKFGQNQWRRIEQWARSTEVQESDVIFFVAPVPVAFLPVEEIRRLIEELKDASVLAGAAEGAERGFNLGSYLGLGGAFLGGVIGGIVGAFLGPGETEDKLEDFDLHNLTSRDLADMWTLSEPENDRDNQLDLVRLMKLLFDLANDIQPNGRQGDRKRAIFVLGGDVHSGSMHVIKADTEQKPAYASNSVLYQITSSAISHSPAEDKTYETIVRHIKPGVTISGIDLIAADNDLRTLAEQKFGDERASFPLDDKKGSAYWAEFVDLLADRNFGRVVFERTSAERRVYEFQLFIEGKDKVLRQSFELDLDADTIQPVDLYNQVAASEGKVSLLRVHEVGSKYGPPIDQIDAEVIVKLDTEPDRAFGFQLRNDNHEAASANMLNTLRDAFRLNRDIRLEYLTTGERNGKIIRVMQ